MKATLEFNLDEQDDRMAHLRAVKSLSMAVILWDMDQYLRGLIKYGTECGTSQEEAKILQKVRDKLWETMSAHSVDLDDLIQ